MSNFYQWRLTCWICCFAILIRFAVKYQSRAEINNEQLNRITADLLQTEATFHRVSRELHRARSKSRSRSRSVRSRRRQQQQQQRATDERPMSPCTSPASFRRGLVEILCFHLVIDDVPRTRLPVITYDDNKENTPYTVTSSRNHLLDDEDDDLVDPRFSVHASNKRHYSLLVSR